MTQYNVNVYTHTRTVDLDPSGKGRGHYLATVGGKTYRVYCDKSTTYMPGWYLEKGHKSGSSRDDFFLGDSRGEALEYLAELADDKKLKNPSKAKPKRRHARAKRSY